MEYKIFVGTLMKIKKGFLKGTFDIMYCGMSSEKTFVLAPYTTSGYQGFSPNIYYDINSTLIQVLEAEFYVLEVNSEFIVLGD